MTIPNGSPTTAKELQLIIERAQRIEGEIEELKLDLKDVFNEAKARGFDSPTIKAVMKWMKKDKNKRNEEAALFEVYLAALGHGESSLSDMARDWLQGKRGDAAIPPEDADGQINAFPTPRKDVDTDFGDDTADEPISVEQAAKMGAEAAQAGRPVTVNPFRAGDERRIAWDKAWCSHLGSDGMDIPAELKPTPKPKKGDDDKKGDDE